MITNTETKVSVDTEKCRELAAVLCHWKIPEDREDTTLPDFDRLQIGNFYLLLVAISHQTSPRGRVPLEGEIGGRRLRGWDYLLAKLEQAAVAQPRLLLPKSWQKITETELLEIFGPSLSGIPQRTELIHDLGEIMVQNDWSWLEDLYEQSKGRIALGSPNLVELLARFRAYSDPVRKKTFFLLALMRNTGLWVYIDTENLGPPVDYHEIRGHLRIGTVQITDPSLESKLRLEQRVSASDDIEIRTAVREAIMLVSETSGIRNPSQLHYLFWNVFRSHCTRESPNCQGTRESSLPERYRNFAYIHGEGSCPFSSICRSVACSDKLQEHVFETEYY